MLALQPGCPGATASAPDYGEPALTKGGHLKQLRRRLLSQLYCIADRGVLGLTPLRTHILICGFPRSGTTLLQMMLENGIPTARRFGEERGGWRAALYSVRNHAVLISKMPHDLFRLDELRELYATRTTRLSILLMQRDPRDVLTSRRTTGGPAGYVVNSQRWRRYYMQFLKERDRADVRVVRYEDLIANVDEQEREIAEFIGEKIEVPFSRFHTINRPDFDVSTLNGLRAIERHGIGRWNDAKHAARMDQVDRELPELSDALVQLGYASHDVSFQERIAPMSLARSVA